VRVFTTFCLVVLFFIMIFSNIKMGYTKKTKEIIKSVRHEKKEEGFGLLKWIESLVRKIFGSKYKKYQITVPIPPPPPPPVFNSTFSG